MTKLLLVMLFSIAVAACGGGGSSSAPTTNSTGSWTPTGSLVNSTWGNAVLLTNGKVLVFGNANGEELYDPATGTWSATGSYSSLHTGLATLLPNGKVLVMGGGSGGTSAELYDPATGSWTATGSLATARSSHTATLLPNGKVLVVGGQNNAALATLASAELYDPATGNWSATGGLTTSRESHTATLLPNGKVLVAAGYSANSSSRTTLASAELYDPATGSWAVTGGLTTSRESYTATLLPNGKVLVAGGRYGATGTVTNMNLSTSSVLASAELYDPANGSWAVAGSLVLGRSGHLATLLPNGKVLVAGGTIAATAGNSTPGTTSAELYQ